MFINLHLSAFYSITRIEDKTKKNYQCMTSMCGSKIIECMNRDSKDSNLLDVTIENSINLFGFSFHLYIKQRPTIVQSCRKELNTLIYAALHIKI